MSGKSRLDPIPLEDEKQREAHYDLHGKLTEVSFFDENGRPTARKGGYARIVRAYDGRGNMIEETVLDLQGKPLRPEGGCAKNELAYDRRGFRIEITCYNEHDRVTFDESGCAKWRTKYNDKGVWIEQACFGLDGASAINKYGWAKRTRTFDAAGKVSRQDLFDANDRLAPGMYGYATIRYRYDEMGRENKREFFDTQGAPVSTHVAIHKVESGSKGERSGLRVGDLILAYDGQEVADRRVFDDFELMLGERPRKLTIQREGRVLTFDITAGRLRGLEAVERSAGSGAQSAKEVTIPRQGRGL
jgi:hypothetical protein